VVGLGLSFESSGLDLDCKIWQSAHLCKFHLQTRKECPTKL